MTPQSRRTNGRGQTTLDFAIAMGLFLLAVSFTFTFIPSLTAPFVEANQDDSVAADRVGSHLALGGLGDPDRPYTVEAACANAFFQDADNDQFPDHCSFTASSAEDRYKQRVGLSDRHDLRIEMLHVNSTESGEDRFRQVCYDNDTDLVTHEEKGGCTADDIDYAIGDDPTDDDSTTVAHRVVTVPGCDFGTDPYGADIQTCDVTLRVIVW